MRNDEPVVVTSTRTDDPILLDTETRSLASLDDVGGRMYVQDPSTEVVGLVARLPDGTFVEWVPGWPWPAPLLRAVEAGVPIAAHNGLKFDRFVWERLGLPTPSAWIDTMQLARLAGLPAALDDISIALGGPGKDQEGRAVMLALSRPDPRTGRLPPIDPEARRRGMQYCHQDVELLVDAWQSRLKAVGNVEAEVRAVDKAINDRGFAFDAELARAIMDMEGRAAYELTAAAPVSGTVLASHKQLHAWLAEAGVAVPDVRRGTLAALLDDPDLPSDVQRVLMARLATARITTNKLRAALRSIGTDGRVRDTLEYYVAHTGRWGGRGIQPHNLPRGVKIDIEAAVSATLAGDLVSLRDMAERVHATLQDVLTTLVRSCVRGTDGKDLAAADYAGIEARGVLWLAQDEEGLARYRRGEAVYEQVAARLFTIDVADVSLLPLAHNDSVWAAPHVHCLGS